MTTRPRRPLVRAFLIIAALVTMEVALRALDRWRGVATDSLYSIVRTEGAGFHLAPNARVVVPERYGDIEYRLNSRGFRDDEWGGHRPDILLLGDSVAFGLGVSQPETFSALLESEIAPGSTVEVRNLAVFAYNTRDEGRVFRETGAPMRAPVVLLQFYLNDYSIPEPSAAAPAPAPPPRARLRDLLRGGWNRLVYSSNLYRRLHQLASGAVYWATHDIRRQRFSGSLNHVEVLHKTEYLKERPRDADVSAFVEIKKLHAAAVAAGSSLIVVNSPDEVQLFEEGFDGLNRRLADFCASEKIPLIDLTGALRDAEPRHRLFLDGVHLSPLGHRVAARAIADGVRSTLSDPSAAGVPLAADRPARVSRESKPQL